MNKKFKTVSILLMLVLIVQIFAGCSSSNSATENSGQNSAGQAAEEQKSGEKITLRVMDWADSEKPYREQFIKDFEARHPDIKIEYTLLTSDQFQNTITTAIKSGDAPDLFPIPPGMKLSTAVAGDWFQPLDQYLDDEFKSRFVDGVFVEGATMQDGKIYTIPAYLPLPNTLVFYNKTLFKEAGLDPENPPKTYSEFRAAAKAITEVSKGKAYGIIEGGKTIVRWKNPVIDWSALGGSGLNPHSPLSLVTNDANYDSDAVINVMNLFKGLKDDGSYHPKTLSISAPEARALFGQGQAGFIIQGEWCIGVWTKDNPDLDFGVMAPPVPDEGQKGYLPRPNFQPWLGMSSQTKHPEAAALYLKEYFSKDYQSVLVKAGDRFSMLKDVNEAAAEIPQFKQYFQVAMDNSRLAPSVEIRNPETSAVFANYKDPQPGLGDIVQGLVSGAIKDPKDALKFLSSSVNTAMDKAIKEAQANGAKVDKEDFVFSNWNADKDYTNEDYAAIKK
ncbi:sugar ABC transporter substrate-binding protein [Paenibacillus woosongensis]|uniref:Sugar ABC transporter substrate-binding protein n=1 Tax=Paenibacillus woosongensis TaxID=307580 RepID=A0AA95KWV6_9BACL|nr:sugar ABC transporter substrate-binding protein [Paenibacillus woosongensis]WHX50110.1 sugar ABC transporter substrate-binding protein [Paenibacillus woosongensis]